ncbi:hypothetical protein H0H81_006302 [Sphagnurus paluster]|uniref:Uncharacterized protein n=1 Tax=Sphagnurus paluster TaxID=117069 RepID=A0A9P7FRF1_9AGAR|nr:hypothetical protein H0H81_006302 [Sphagnurus paluster]
MATPSSSATSPSPPMTYLQHATGQPQPSPIFMDPMEKEQRQRAIEKFMARAEISTVTRALRTRLSYASYKAVHNIHHIPLRDLEAQSQTQSQSASFSRTIAAKRKAAGSNNYYNNPATQGPHGISAGSSSVRRAGSSGSMPPPSTTSSPRTYYPAANANAYATTSNNDPGSSSRTGPNQSLYTSILAPPASKQARTIHNAGDPPVSASSRPLASPRARAPKPTSRSTAEATRSHAKSRKLEHPSSPGSPNTRKVKRTPTSKGKQRQRHSTGVDADGDIDMKAAATLTSLLLNHRPPITGSASSPRSSIDGSEAGSAYSYSHFAQSSARTIAAASPSVPVPAATSASTIADSSFRSHTPPAPLAPSENPSNTPLPAPTDNEAANLMLYLATSPSPARPTTKDSRDLVAYRALGGSPSVLRDKGRVLFAGSAESVEYSKSQPLTRGGETSFTSSISSIGTDMGGSVMETSARIMPTPAQLLPPPSLPSQNTVSGTPPQVRKDANDSLRMIYPSSVEFNFSDFIHGSPSPSRGPILPAPKANLGLRADVGRKLFEEEQMRHVMSSAQSPGKRRDDRALGAGIDLVPT